MKWRVFRPRAVPAPSVAHTAERMAVAIATGVKHGELTEQEHLHAVAIGAYFGDDFDRKANQIAELERQVAELTNRVRDLAELNGRMAG